MFNAPCRFLVVGGKPRVVPTFALVKSESTSKVFALNCVNDREIFIEDVVFPTPPFADITAINSVKFYHTPKVIVMVIATNKSILNF